MPGESIGRQVGYSRFIHHFVLQVHELYIHLEMPWCVEVLIWDVHQTATISKDDDLVVLEVGTPLVNCDQDGSLLLLIC